MLTSSTQLQNMSFYVMERTRTSAKCRKMKNARAKRAKLLFFFVKYANLWRSCCRRRRGCLSSLLAAATKTSLQNIELWGRLSVSWLSHVGHVVPIGKVCLNFHFETNGFHVLKVENERFTAEGSRSRENLRQRAQARTTVTATTTLENNDLIG